jgi:predicted O-linked N-acetylglucosamine transferase (SPINDLY family)
MLLSCIMPYESRRSVQKPYTGGKRSPHASTQLTDLVMQGFALHRQGRLEEAQAIYQRVLEKNPRDFDALHMLGLIAARLKNPSRAVELIGKAIAVNPLSAAAHSNLGASLKALQRLDAAVASYQRAIQLEPNTAEAHSNLGNALRELRRVHEALACYDRAIALKPDYADAFYNRGNALNDLKRRDEAAASFARALELNPGCEFLLGTVIHAFHHLCEWGDFDENNRFLQSRIESREKASPPFPVCTAFDSPALQKIAAEVWTQAKAPPRDTLGPLRPSTSHGVGRIRLGYFSADFCDHATTCLMAELFELHDRKRFELFAFSFGPDAQDAMRHRVAAAFDHFIDVSRLPDLEVARMSRELGIDIAVDLKGHTQDARPGIFSYRCAPIQVNYLGYPGTMGADYMDYLIADPALIPEQGRIHYTEKIAYLPHSYQVNDSKRRISEKQFTREECGLPDGAFVFCCFNNNFKITPQTFEGWMRILKAVSGSVLWLLEDNALAAQNLRKEAQARGIPSSRLVFAERIPLAEHLARHKLADLFLDTLPCNAHTTASDALWAGLPVLTLAGNSFAGRVAASLLNAIGLPELITSRQKDYETLAIALANQPGQLATLREKISRNRLSAPLYDVALFTQHIEAAYEAIHARSLAALPPQHLTITA